MLYVFYGQDQFRARDELQKVRRELDKDGNLAHNTVASRAPMSAASHPPPCAPPPTPPPFSPKTASSSSKGFWRS